MILQKSFQYVDLLSMLETVVLLILFIYLETVILFWGSLINTNFKRTAFIQNRDVFLQYKYLLSLFLSI